MDPGIPPLPPLNQHGPRRRHLEVPVRHLLPFDVHRPLLDQPNGFAVRSRQFGLDRPRGRFAPGELRQQVALLNLRRALFCRQRRGLAEAGGGAGGQLGLGAGRRTEGVHGDMGKEGETFVEISKVAESLRRLQWKPLNIYMKKVFQQLSLLVLKHIRI